jgi:transposase
MKPHVFGSSKTAKISAAAPVSRRQAASHDHRKLVCNRLSRRIDLSPRVNRCKPAAGKTYNPITQPRKSRRAFVQSGFREVRTPAPQKRAADLTEASRFPWREFSDSFGAKEIRAMPAAVKLREDFSAEQLWALARRSKDVNQSRRLLSLAAVRDGKDRGEAARIGGMDRQTLRDWVHRFNAAGPEGLFDNWTDGPKSRLSAEQLATFAKIVEAGPDRERDGVVRWRRVDLKRVIAETFGVDFHERYVGALLKKLGFSHISARPRHPAQDGEIVEAYKKTSKRR